MDLSEIGWEAVDWVYPVQDMDQWRAVMETVMSSASIKGGEFLTS